MNDPIRTDTPDDAQLAAYREQGYLLLPGLISLEDAGALAREVLGIMDLIGLGQSKLKQTHEYLAGTAIDALVNSPTLKSLAGRLMEGEAVLYMPFTAVKSGQGGGEFHFHQDNQYTRFDGPGINLWFALTPATEETGCLRIVPRSHLQGTLDAQFSPDGDTHRTITFTPDEFVPMRMEPGDCVAFSRLTVHGSGPNTSGEHRAAYAVQFARTDIRYTVDGGESWHSILEKPRWPVGPVQAITVPTASKDGH